MYVSYLLKSLHISVYQYPIRGSLFRNNVTELDWSTYLDITGSSIRDVSCFCALLKFISGNSDVTSPWSSIGFKIPVELCNTADDELQRICIFAFLYFVSVVVTIFFIVNDKRFDKPFSSSSL